VAALRYRLLNDNKDATKIKRHPIDNLPDHIKRNVDLDPADEQGAEWSTKQKGYVAKLRIDDSTRDSFQEQPVEFIHNKETGVDNWYLVTHGLLVRFCLLCGDQTAYCTDMGSCECGLPFLEPFVFLLDSMRTSDGGLPI